MPIRPIDARGPTAHTLTETRLLGEGAAFAVDTADSHPHAAGRLDVEIQPRTIQNIVTTDLILFKFDTTRGDTAISVHHNQANLIRAIGLGHRCAEDGNHDGYAR